MSQFFCAPDVLPVIVDYNPPRFTPAPKRLVNEIHRLATLRGNSEAIRILIWRTDSPMSEPGEEPVTKTGQNNNGSPDPGEGHELEALAAILPEVIASFNKVNLEGRKRLLDTVATFFGIESGSAATSAPLHASGVSFSEDRSISPKEFLRQKQPRTDMERVACLAYYLTHYRDTPHFKTLDISQLNTEAAQIKFANAANSVNNASTYGYLAATTKGNKQLTAVGEAFVEALPDRDAAREAMSNARPRRKRKSGDPKKNGERDNEAVGVVSAGDDGKTP